MNLQSRRHLHDLLVIRNVQTERYYEGMPAPNDAILAIGEPLDISKLCGVSGGSTLLNKLCELSVLQKLIYTFPSFVEFLGRVHS